MRIALSALLCLVPAAAFGQWNDSLLKPFVMNHRAATANSPADVSFLLDAPAGKNGFVRVVNGHLAKPEGSRLRLWGVHLTDWSRGSVLLPPKEDTPMWAQMMFLRGDVRPAEQTDVRSYSRDQSFQSRKLGRDEQPYFTPGFPAALPLIHGSRIGSFDGPPTRAYSPLTASPIVSDTKELTWFTSSENTGLVTVETDRTQALIGFVRKNRKSLKNFSADIDNTFATLVLSSLDTNPLSRSSRMLLSAGSRVSNTGLKWNAERTRTVEQGGPPSLVEPVTGRITLRNLADATSVSAVALDGAGNAIGEPITATKAPDGWMVPIGAPVTTCYVVSVARR